MARVPTSTQVGGSPAGPIQAEFRPLAGINTPVPPAGAFGAESARAIGNAGRELQGAGQDLTRYVVTEANLENETEATNRATETTRRMQEMTQGYLNLRGQAAVDGYAGFQEQIRALEQETLSGATPAVQRLMRPRIQGQTTSVLAGANRWRSEQGVNANISSAEGAADLELNNGLMFRDDPEQMAGALARGRAMIARAGQTAGHAPEAIEARQSAYTGRFYSNIIQQTLVGDPASTDPARAPNPLAAQRIFEQHRDQMDASTQLRVQQMLEGPVIQRASQDRVAAAQAAPPTGAIPLVRGQPNSPEFDAVQARIFRAENAAGDTRRNPNSSASGPGQITQGTWDSYAARLGLRPDQRNDPEAQRVVFRAFQEDAQDAVGRPLNGGEMYAAWFLGIAGFKRFLNAPPDANAQETYAAASSPDRAAQAQRFNATLWPEGATVGQVLDNVYARYGQQGGGTAYRADRGGVMARALEGTDTNPQLRNQILSELNRQWSVQDAMSAQERAGLQRRVGEMEQALRTGAPNVSIPRQDILRVFEPQDAAHIIDRLSTAQISGQMFQAIQVASPQRLQEIQQDIASGSGPISAQLRQARGIRLQPDGSVNPEDAASDAASRLELRNTFATAVEQRRTMIAGDPAAYVAADAAVQTANAAVAAAPNDPNNYRLRGEARRAAQTHLGVAGSDVRTLTRTESAALAQRITRLDPAAGDLGQQMAGVAAAFGPEEWQRAFADMMRDQSLPPAYMFLANMSSPVGRADLTRMLQTARELGGIERLRQNAPEQARQQIPELVDRALADFTRSTNALNTTGGHLLGTRARQTVADLAFYYATYDGRSPSQAVNDAAARVINDQYTFSGELRVPRTVVSRGNTLMPMDASTVRRSLPVIMERVTAENLADWPESGTTAGMTPEQRNLAGAAAARRGTWVTNERDNGAFLAIQLDNGGTLPARWRDGSRVEIMFNDLPQPVIRVPQEAPRRNINPGRGMADPAAAPQPRGTGTQPAAPRDEGGRAAPTPTAPPAGNPQLPGDRGSPRSGRWVRPDAVQ